MSVKKQFVEGKKNVLGLNNFKILLSKQSSY